MFRRLMSLSSEELTTRLNYYSVFRHRPQKIQCEGARNLSTQRPPRLKAEFRDALPASRFISADQPLDIPQHEHFRAAGILPYARHEDQIYILLGEESKKKGEIIWSCFGGKREGFEDDPATTAVREFVEETGGVHFASQQESFTQRLLNPTSRGPVVWLKDSLYLLFALQVDLVPLRATWTESLSSIAPSSSHVDTSSSILESSLLSPPSLTSTLLSSSSSLLSSSSSSSSFSSSSCSSSKKSSTDKVEYNPCHEKTDFVWVPYLQLKDLVQNRTSVTVHDIEDGKSRTISRLSGYLHGLLSTNGAIEGYDEYFINHL